MKKGKGKIMEKEGEERGGKIVRGKDSGSTGRKRKRKSIMKQTRREGQMEGDRKGKGKFPCQYYAHPISVQLRIFLFYFCG